MRSKPSMSSALRGASLVAAAAFAVSCRSPQGAPSMSSLSEPSSKNLPSMTVRFSEDFDITGEGSTPAWAKTEWVSLRRREPAHHPYETKVKVLYSRSGLYVLMSATDSRITATMAEDFLDLWNEDVFEVFLWPDEKYPVYFEYEISPLGYELPILIPNLDGQFLGWRPWHYEGERRVRKATAAQGGPREPGASISGWTAEVFIPWALLKPLRNVPPSPGTQWRANFYRVDYDGGKATSWDWAPVGKSFHEFRRHKWKN